MRLTGSFVTRFMEEWKFTGDTMIHTYRGTTLGEQHQRVERFLEAMKYELAAVIVPSVIPNATLTAVAPHTINIDSKYIISSENNP